jgi:hypothetical protein
LSGAAAEVDSAAAGAEEACASDAAVTSPPALEASGALWLGVSGVLGGVDGASCAVLPSAVKRSVSVTDFLSALVGFVTRGVGCIQRNRRVRVTVDCLNGDTRIDGVKSQTVNYEKNLVASQ